MRQKRGSRTFAVRSGYGGHPAVALRKFRQKFSAPHLRYAELGGGRPFRIVLGDRRRVNQHVDVRRDVFRRMPGKYRNAVLCELGGLGVGDQVGTGDKESVVERQKRKRRHPGSADPDEMQLAGNAESAFHMSVAGGVHREERNSTIRGIECCTNADTGRFPGSEVPLRCRLPRYARSA